MRPKQADPGEAVPVLGRKEAAGGAVGEGWGGWREDTSRQEAAGGVSETW